MSAFKTLYDYCEDALDFEVTLALLKKPDRDSSGRLRHNDASDSQLGIEIFNMEGHKVVQVRQANKQTVDGMAEDAFGLLEEKGFGPKT